MDPERTTHRQLIDDQKNFHRDSMESVAKVLGTVDRQYFSVAIIGVQNSGKSTLLNKVFGTNFDVLKEQAGSRTTRGILNSVDKSESIIIFDVEGNDSMDRSEEQDYEKMVATYALVTANVLIINIWSKSLGQYTGSQYETLKVIMEISMSQFKQESPKTILYCVRDFNADYDDEGEIRRKIIRDVNDLWRKLDKPEQLEAYNNKPEKLFNIEVVVISKYREGKVGKFDDDIAALRQKFVDPKAQGFIFANQKTQYNLPISDLPQLSENSWISIKSNKKLNLPSQKQQLASFRCSTILSEIQNQFELEMKAIEDKNISQDYGKIKTKYLSKFEEKTYHYGKNVVDAKREELQTTIDDYLKNTVYKHIQIRANQIVSKFTSEAKNCQSEIKNSKSLDQNLKNLIITHVEEFVNDMKKMGYEIPDRKEKIDQLNSKLNDSFKDIKATILKLSYEQFQNESSRSVRLMASEVIKNHFGEHFWEQAWKQFNESVTSIVDKYRAKYLWITGQGINPIMYDEIQQKITEEFKHSVKSELEKTFTTRILDYFNKSYSADESGDRINFNLKTEQEIGAHFDITRDSVIFLITQLNDCNKSKVTKGRRSSFIEGMDDESSFFESTWLSNTTEIIEKSMRNEYEKTMRRKKEGQMNIVPWWLYIIIFYFVYDDIWFSAEESPIIHYSLVAILLVLTLLIAIGQGKIVQEGIRIMTDALKDRVAFLR